MLVVKPNTPNGGQKCRIHSNRTTTSSSVYHTDSLAKNPLVVRMRCGVLEVVLK
jgi:hypothetical protein